MKLFCFYGKPVSIKYHNQLCSSTTLVVCTLSVAAFVLPYYILSSVKRGELWDQHQLVYEQPRVKFLYAYLFLAEMEASDDGSSVVTCSSFESYNTLTEHLYPCSEVRVVPIDSDHDHALDHLAIAISFNPPDVGSRLMYYTFYFFLEATVTSQCSFVVPSFVSLEKVPAPKSKFDSGTIVHHGFLQSKQTASLQCPFFMRHQKSHFSDRYYPNENTTLDGFQPRVISALIQSSNPARYEFHPQRTDWTTDDSGSIRIEMNISIGDANSRETALLYQTSLWRRLCQFWGSYFPLLIVSMWLTNKIKQYLFEHFYLRAVEVVPWKVKYN
ncbi:transmembrane protein 231 [Anopheles nili]|uniref:transmembrane protein 231 n=1 Tax=Anopheles nili TaxID=185578 RepID=UPI00237B7404|nr:transmembrane protein 231 [Anopheles nili]